VLDRLIVILFVRLLKAEVIKLLELLDLVELELVVDVRLEGGTYWYNDKPLGPPQISAELPVQTIEHLPSVVVTEPELRVSPQ
jgi:hypothetical protein